MLEQPGDSGQPLTLLIIPPDVVSQGAVAEQGITPAHKHTPVFGTVLRSPKPHARAIESSAVAESEQVV